MSEPDYRQYDEEEPWEGVQLTKEAIRARAMLTLYTTLLSAPFIALVAWGASICGLKPNEVVGISCYNAMISALFFFDTLRNAAHDCFDQAEAAGLVESSKGIPVIAASYRHRRLATLSFAIGGRRSPRNL